MQNLALRNCFWDKIMSNSLAKLRDSLADLRIITAKIVVLFKTALFGVLSAEIWLFSITFADKINNWVFVKNYEFGAFVIYALCLILLVVFLLIRGVFTYAKKIIRSRRIDIFVAFCFGVWLSVTWGGFLSALDSRIVTSLSIRELLTIATGLFILGILIIVNPVFGRKEEVESSFVVDLELDERKDDLLNFADKANRFAERVFNGGSPDSFVFGVDAPWGIGKSTFVNFCKEYWKEKHGSETIVYKFSPLRYARATNLLDVFIDGLIHAIQKDSFVPEIKPLISRYSQLLKEVSGFTLFGFSLPTLTFDYTADDACDDLSAVLKHFSKKVIIIVDDLDRISFSELKDILFVIRKSFVLPNVSYIICYDTDNIGVLEAESPDAEKISEFLEKFVNIKISLYLDREDLAEYVSGNLDKALATKLIDPFPVRQAIGGLLDIYKSTTYHMYLPFIGDVRKLKRLINTVVMFELETTDFKNSDFNKGDLIHLLLIYIHYPSVFRKIYETETKGGRGFFSLVIPYEDGYPEDQKTLSGPSSNGSRYSNSIYYQNYISQFPEESRQRFLLEQVFNVNKRLENTRIDSVTEDVRTSLACFNGEWTNGRNLEIYLNLIVDLAKPDETGQHRFYANWKDQIAEGSITIEKAFADPNFGYDKSEEMRSKLWRILVNNARKLNHEVSAALIAHLLENTPDYSLLEVPTIGIGLRHDLDYLLVRLLNEADWTGRSGKHSGNTEENIMEIAEWIFDEGRHSKNGVLAKLSQADRGVLGLHDLMLFRLFCSADRGGDIFNVSRALSEHGNENPPTQGDTRIIAKEEMREISQKVFEIFKLQYLDTSKNIFDEIEALRLTQLAGKYENYLESKIQEGIVRRVDIDELVAGLKSRIAIFIIYQLGNDLISSGVGCGFYDPEGREDKRKIKNIINDYLFDLCFDPGKAPNIEHFIDFLLRTFTNVFPSDRETGLVYSPHINGFTTVLDKVKLAKYWQTHSSEIKALNLDEKDKTVFVGNYAASYREYLPITYKVLDDHVRAMQIEAHAEIEQDNKN